MAGVDAVAALLDELDYVVAVFGFDDFRHLLWVVEVECHGCVLGHKLSASHEADFAAAHALGGLGVEDGEG